MVLPDELWAATVYGDIDTVRQFVESNPERVNEDFEVERGFTLLTVAMLSSDRAVSTEMVRYLIRRGADVECRNKEREHPKRQ